MDSICIDIGVYTSLEIDLSEFDFSGVEKLVMTGKNTFSNDVVFEREFRTAEIHVVTITPQESVRLAQNCEYDFNVVTQDGKQYKATENGAIVLREGCGRCSESL